MHIRVIYEFDKDFNAMDKFHLRVKQLREMERELVRKIYKTGISLDMIEEND